MDSSKTRSPLVEQKQQLEEQEASMVSNNKLPIWYCPSRWLMAHHDPQANIYTMSSHMCLADLNNDGEHLLALVDFKLSPTQYQEQAATDLDGRHRPHAPYNCRLRVYRGQQLIYNHFLDDIPSCMFATSIKVSTSGSNKSQDTKLHHMLDTPHLTLAINDDVYFHHKLKPSHRFSLEDDARIMSTLNKSEFDAWQMVRDNKVDAETMRELLLGLKNELGTYELTSHTNNFLALSTAEERKNYLLLWKFKRLNNGLGEHLMSIDTICCGAARLKFASNITLSGDYGQTRDSKTPLMNSIKWNKILEFQKDGLVLGTEDRHVIFYELRTTRAHMESHYRLPSTPDRILVERQSPASFRLNNDYTGLTYKVLISCRNCKIYSIDQNYFADRNSFTQVRELLALKCNVLDMSWTGDEPSIVEGMSYPNFVVACLDRRVYCFNSHNGQCKWMVALELPVTCLISLPIPNTGVNESSIIGVASQTGRIDFYVSSTGRIVDSIYFRDDHCQAMTFGRFGREDNCLCLTTKSGHLLILILKRTANFSRGQCLSSAASHASDTLLSCSQNYQAPQRQDLIHEQQLKLNEPPKLPSAFSLTKSAMTSATDRTLDLLAQSDHNCDQELAKSLLDAQLTTPKLQIPVKSRDFVDQIVDQSRHSAAISELFSKHMVKLRDKIRSTLEQQAELRVKSNYEDGNRITVSKIVGLGNTYRVSLSLRLNLKLYAERHHLLSKEDGTHEQPASSAGQQLEVSVLILAPKQRPRCQVKPFKLRSRFEGIDSRWMFEKTIEFKLLTTQQPGNATVDGGQQQQEEEEEESVSLDLWVLVSDPDWLRGAHDARDELERPVFISSVNIPTC